MIETTQDECRREFEEWAFPYLKRQYCFYNEAVIRNMMLWKSEGKVLWDAWQAAYSRRNDGLIAKIKQQIYTKRLTHMTDGGGNLWIDSTELYELIRRHTAAKPPESKE